LCRQIYRELEDLTRLRQENGTSIPGRLGRFNPKEPVKELKLNTIVVDVERIAPML